MRIKLIIFDLDGTLVNAYRAVARSLNYALQKVNLSSVDHETIRRSVGWGDRNLIKRFVPEKDLEKVLSIYRKHHQEALKTGTTFLPGAKGVLRRLSQKGYRLAIASNRPTHFTKIILRHLKIHGCFECVLCGDKVKHPKPAGDILKGILKKFSVQPSAALYIGDMTIDAQTGRNAGVKTVIVVTGSSTWAEVKKYRPYKIIRKLTDVMALIDTLNQ